MFLFENSHILGSSAWLVVTLGMKAYYFLLTPLYSTFSSEDTKRWNFCWCNSFPYNKRHKGKQTNQVMLAAWVSSYFTSVSTFLYGTVNPKRMPPFKPSLLISVSRNLLHPTQLSSCLCLYIYCFSLDPHLHWYWTFS